MELMEVIRNRRSVRKYTSRQINDKDIEEILQAGMYAPSAVNLQPWYYVAVRTPDEIAKMKNIMTNASSRLEPNLRKRFEKHPEVVRETLNFIGRLGNAPLVIMAFLNRDDYSQEEEALNQSVAASIQNMLLAAWEKGIGSCWMTAPLEAEVDSILKEYYAPDHGKMIAMITFGYPETIPAMPRRREGRYRII